jgi:hypothetical protein
VFIVALKAGRRLHYFLLERVWREHVDPLNALLRLGNVSIGREADIRGAAARVFRHGQSGL